MLIAGVLPGLLLTVGYSALIYVRCLFNPRLGPAGPKFSVRERLEILPKVLPFLIIIAAVILGILFGVWTPVESAAVAVVMVGAIVFLRRRITMGRLLIACRDAVVMSTSVFIIGSLAYSGFLALNGFSDLIAQTIIDMHLGSFGLFLWCSST